MRYYTPIWEKLKKEKTAKVVVNSKLHARVIKAVKKEKWMDIPFKLEHDDKRAVLSHTRKGNVLTFFLELKKDITAEDL